MTYKTSTMCTKLTELIQKTHRHRTNFIISTKYAKLAEYRSADKFLA